jgi:hypothetical protein
MTITIDAGHGFDPQRDADGSSCQLPTNESASTAVAAPEVTISNSNIGQLRMR